MSTGEDILAKGMDASLAAIIRSSAAGLVKSGVVSNDLLAKAQAMDTRAFPSPTPAALAMNEAAIAFQYDALSEETELKKYREAKTTELRTMMVRLQLSPELRAEIEGAIQSLSGATSKQAIDALAHSISHQIQDASQYTTSQNTLNDQEARELRGQIEHLNNVIREIDKKIDQLIGGMQDKGVVYSKNDLEEYAALKAYADAHPEDEEARKRYEEKQRWMVEEAKRQAQDPNSRVWDRDGVLVDVKVAEDKQNEREQAEKDKIEAQAALVKYEETARESKVAGSKKAANVASFYDDEEEQAFTQAAPDKQRAVIAKTTTPKEEMLELGNLSPTVVPNNTIPGGRSIG